MSPNETPIAAQLRHVGLRVTAPRHGVLEWLDHHPHATAEEVGTGVRQRLGTISRQAVYDVLGACTDAGLVRQIQPAGHPARFERRIDDNHHHVVCRGCGHIEDVDCVGGSRPCLAPQGDETFVVDEAEVIFWGLCPACNPGTRPGPQDANDPVTTDEDLHDARGERRVDAKTTTEA